MAVDDELGLINAQWQDWTPEEQAWVRDHAGMYMWEEPREGPADPDYALSELTAIGRRLGLRVARTFLGGFGHGRNVGTRQTFVETLETEPYRDFIASFPTVFFTVAIPPETWDPAWTVPVYQELTEHLLTTYRDRDVTFVLGNWEGDYWCPGTRSWDEAIGLFAARQEGIERGRAAVPVATARVYHMIEMVKLDYTGQDLMINNLAPHVPADLYSLSCYGYINELPRALDYMRGKCPASPDFGHDNLVLGEWGVSYSVKWPPVERVRFFQQRVREMIAGRLAYCLYWELEDKDDGLMDGKYQRGRKFSLYYPFYRAYHGSDSVLTIDDFESDPHGPPEGDANEYGHAVNALGGECGPIGDAQGSLLWQEAEGARVATRALALALPEGAATGSGWQERLAGGLNADLRTALQFDAKGELAGLQVRLEDAAGNSASVAVPAGASQREWRTIRLPRAAFEGVDWGRLSGVAVVLGRPGDGRVVLLDDLALMDERAAPTPAAHGSRSRPRLAQIALRSPDVVLPCGGGTGAVTRVGMATPLAAEAVVAPTITDGTRAVEIAGRLPALHSVWLGADGTGEVRFEPLSCFMYPQHFAQLGIVVHNLARRDDVTRGIWGDVFPAFQLVDPAESGWIEWQFVSPWLVDDFRLTLYLHSREERPPTSGVGIAVSFDGKAWTECAHAPADATIWHEDTLVATPPVGLTRGAGIAVRYWIRTVEDDPEWRLHAGIRNLKARLTLATRTACFPRLDSLRYTDSGPVGESYRGLLSLDW